MSMRLMAHMVSHGSPAVVPITADQYERMMALGILDEGAPIELIDGMLLFKDRRDAPAPPMTQGPRHLLAIKILAKLLENLLPSNRFHVQQQGPVVCNESNVPEPDVCILKGLPDRYGDRLPGAADVVLAIEVSQTSLDIDQYDKAELYNRSGVPSYWIINLADDTVIVHAEPRVSARTYGQQTVVPRGGVVALDLPGSDPVEISVDDLLPGRFAP